MIKINIFYSKKYEKYSFKKSVFELPISYALLLSRNVALSVGTIQIN